MYMAGTLSDLTDSFQSNVQGSVSEFSTNLTSTISGAIGGGEMTGETLFPKFDIENIDIRSKLEVECPDFMKQCGISKIDFGGVFLSTPALEGAFAQAQNIANDVIDSVNGLQQFISPDTIIAIQNLITFIITDLIETVIGYCMNLFQTYISPEFPIGLAKDLVTQTATVVKNNTKNPADLLKELNMSTDDLIDSANNEALQKLQGELMNKINETFGNVTSKIKKVMDEIQPYTSKIAYYVKYGPEYAAEQVELLYKKYLGMGISIVDEEIGKLMAIIDFYINFAAEKGGMFLATQANNLQIKVLKKTIDAVNAAKQKILIIANAMINKAIMNLMGLLGG